MTLYTNTAWLVAHCALSALQATGTDTCTGPAPQWGQFGLSTPTIRPQPLALAGCRCHRKEGAPGYWAWGGAPLLLLTRVLHSTPEVRWLRSLCSGNPNNEDTLWSGDTALHLATNQMVTYLRSPHYLSRPSTVGLFVLTHTSIHARSVAPWFVMQTGFALSFR